MPDVDMPEGQMRLMPLAPPAPQRIPGRLRSLGPISQVDVLLTAGRLTAGAEAALSPLMRGA